MATTDTKELPKPHFLSCDETSIKLKIDYSAAENEELLIEYKEPHIEWSEASSVVVSCNSSSKATVNVSDVVDLKPGTPYFIRLVVVDKGKNVKVFGPETVFDTKPIDCGPKRRTCILS